MKQADGVSTVLDVICMAVGSAYRSWTYKTTNSSTMRAAILRLHLSHVLESGAALGLVVLA